MSTPVRPSLRRGVDTHLFQEAPIEVRTEVSRKSPTPRVFTLENGGTVHTVTGRTEAVRKARELSSSTWRPIRVERRDARVEMIFRRGELQTYTYTSNRKSRK